MAVNHQNLSKKSLQTSLFTATQYLSRKSVLPGAIFSCLHSVSAAMREGHPASWTALFEYYSLTHRS